MSVVLLRPDPLLSGFYTLTEATRLLRVESRRRIKGWLQDRDDVYVSAIIDRDYPPIGKTQELSFWDLMEVRFIEHFRQQGLTLQYLRKVSDAARKELKHKHPFALANFKFQTDRKKIFIHVAESDGDAKTRHALGDQYEMYDVIEAVLARGVEFDPRTHLADSWRPLHLEHPNVIVHPRFAYGHPVISDKHVATSAIFRMFRAERGNKAKVARAFGVSQNDVNEAVEFEVKLAA
jgi:uncharacterized protein (DUF433 family)